MILIKDKRAQIFTLIAIVLIGFLFITFELFSVANQKNTVKDRISTMDDYLSAIEANLGRQLYISGFRIIFLAEDHITRTGSYIDVNNFFNEAFFNGTVDGNASDILFGAKYSDLVNSINNKAEKINVDVALNDYHIELSQSDPWNVNFSLAANLTMTDKANLARWERREVVSVFIPVIEFVDPIYIVNTNGKVSQKINRTIYDSDYVHGTDVSNLADHVNKRYYAANSLAPSFLKRLAGDLSSDPNGIESFVDIDYLSKQGISAQSKSAVDYIYFSGNNPPFYSVNGMPSWFRIDNAHVARYNLTGVIY